MMASPVTNAYSAKVTRARVPKGYGIVAAIVASVGLWIGLGYLALKVWGLVHAG